ncbi:MAG: hypothetical protein JNK04_01600 [Myxococcales bacterium]|nr:hypothetical protein [Myxococcales bacterium]
MFTTREAPPEAKPFRQRCAPGRVVDGFLLSTTALGHLTVLGGAQIICRSIAVKDGQMQSTGAGTEPAGSPLSGVEASPCGCAADELVVGVRGRFGGYVDSLGLRCGKRQMKP